MMNRPLRVLLTGASSGIGKRLAEQLLADGHEVLAIVRGDESRLKGLFDEHSRLNFIRLDLIDTASFSKVPAAIERNFDSRLDVLVNAAGYGYCGPLELQSAEEIKTQMQVNFFAPLQLIQDCLPYLRKSRGKVFNITSMAAFTVFPFYGSYAASKYALHAASEALHEELRPFGVQVSAIEPGGFKTEFRKNMKHVDRAGHDAYRQRIDRFMAFQENFVAKIEKDPMQVVRLVARLCGKEKLRPRYVVGRDAWANLAMRKLIPDRWFIPLQGWVYRKFFF